VQADSTAMALLEIVRQLAHELHPQDTRVPTLDSDLERDLGLDSLARVELLTRIEKAFAVSLTERVLASVETPRDLVDAVLAASGMAPTVLSTMQREFAPERVEAAPHSAATLLEVLDWHVAAHPERCHITLLGEAEQEEKISYGDLLQGAERIAAGLLALELQPGQAVAIMLPTSRDYFFSFFGVLLAGGVPLPIYPPARLSQIEDHLRRHAGILSNALAAILITLPEARPLARLLRSQVESLQSVVTPEELNASGTAGRPSLKSGDTALLQYTSGSTGNPKGVVLTHANLLANIRAMGQAAQVTSTDVFVSWLPLYHDMGLIGAWLGSLYFACPLVVMSPLSFLARPARWLWAIHHHRGTLSAAPNFGYELCLHKIQEVDLQGLDLSSWRMAFNGAEPVSPETIERFAQHFERYGLRREAIAPVYGLAECSVGLAFPPPGRGPLIDHIRRDVFSRSGQALPADAGEPDPLRIVACGQPLPGHQIRIVDATGHELGERQEGRLEFKGPSATSGYLRNPEQTRSLLHDGWLDSGDLAYVAAGDVYLTGRAKDVIIRGGRNLYPYELEQAVGDLPGIRKGCVAVFGSRDHGSGTERLVVLAETRETEPATLERLRLQINTAALDLLGMPPDEVVLAPMHTVPKTSSGKIRRAASREVYEQGLGRVQPRAVWWQIVRLAWFGVLPELRRGLQAAGQFFYATYVWILFWLLAPLTWLVAVLLPRPASSWSVGRLAARLLAWISASPLRVQGLENLPPGQCVVVANHASYLDGVVLVAVLPRQFSFVAKRELLEGWIPRLFLKRLGAAFVERFDAQRGVEDVQQILQTVGAGSSPLFFPEGTFTRAPGLLPFRMGAFVVAAQAGLPLVPVTLRGTRSVLREGHWFPRRGVIEVVIGTPILPTGADWAAALRLRDAARAEILRCCGEPDMGRPVA